MMSELSLKDKMKLEALERLELLNASPLSRAKILNDWNLTKNVVDSVQMTVNEYGVITDEEEAMIRNFEKEYDVAVYYVIQDEGIWPDGCTFPRYTFLYIGQNEEEWDMDKEECIIRCKTLPAYVVNMEEPDCSEITEIGYQVVGGTIINVT